MRKNFFYTITERCIGTKARECVKVCPVDCIYDLRDPSLNKENPQKREDSRPYPYEQLVEKQNFDKTLDWGILVIDPDTCIKCGLCEIACPVKAIKRISYKEESQFSFLVDRIKMLSSKEDLNAKNFLNHF